MNELKFNPKQHAYWYNGTRCKGATTLAKIPDDTYRLDQWRKRMVAIGMAMTPKLVESVAAHWDQRDRVEDCAEQAMEAAKAFDASQRGTDAHRIAQRIDLDEQLIDTPLARQVRAAWTEALEEAGLEIIPEFVERIVVYPDLYWAGTFDRLARRWQDGKLVILDLKTGTRAVQYPHAIAVQLAIYANAPLLAGPIPPSGGATTDFAPMPTDIDLTTGYVVHMPSEAQVQVVEIDILAGQQAVEDIIKPTLEWRANKNLARQTISAATWAPTPRLVAVDGTVEPQDPPPTAPVPSTTTVDTKRLEWIRAWVQGCADHTHLARLWPDNVAIPRNSGWRQWTDHDIDLIADACQQVDAANGAAFWPPDPTQPTPTGIQTRRTRSHESVS